MLIIVPSLNTSCSTTPFFASFGSSQFDVSNVEQKFTWVVSLKDSLSLNGTHLFSYSGQLISSSQSDRGVFVKTISS